MNIETDFIVLCKSMICKYKYFLYKHLIYNAFLII